MIPKKIAVIIGSLRKESFNRKLARALILYAPASLTFEIVEISTLPFYNQDFDDQPPAPCTDFRNKIKSFDGVLFVTPEYNRSIPGVLKNAIDIASRPYGQNAFDEMPGAIVSASVGALGGFGANHHLRQILMYLNIPTMAQPEAYIGDVAKLFDENGKLTHESTQIFISKFMISFAQWINQNSL